MKEFKDAKKAMEKAQEQGQKKAISVNADGSSNGNIGRPKKGKKAQGLLKAAILNNARGERGKC